MFTATLKSKRRHLSTAYPVSVDRSIGFELISRVESSASVRARMEGIRGNHLHPNVQPGSRRAAGSSTCTDARRRSSEAARCVRAVHR